MNKQATIESKKIRELLDNMKTPNADNLKANDILEAIRKRIDTPKPFDQDINGCLMMIRWCKDTLEDMLIQNNTYQEDTGTELGKTHNLNINISYLIENLNRLSSTIQYQIQPKLPAKNSDQSL